MTAFTATGTDLWDALANVSPHVERSGTLPALAAVQVTVAENGLVTFVATDRYSLGVVEVVSKPDTPIAPGAFLLPLEAVADVQKIAKKFPDVTVACDGTTIVVSTYENTASFRPELGEFPKWRSLWPEGSDEHTLSAISFSTLNLSKIGKAYKSGRALKPIVGAFVFRFGATSVKPVIATCAAADLSVLLMPVRT